MTRASLVGGALAAALAGCAPSAPPPAAPPPAPTAPAPATPATPPVVRRQAPPPPLPERPVAFPPFVETTLPNGLTVIVVEKTDAPVASARLYVRTGSAADPVAKVGLADLVARTLTQGTQRRTARQIAETIERVGGNLDANATLDYLVVSTGVLAEHLPLAMDLLADVVRRPTFPAQEFATERSQALAQLRLQLAQAGVLAQRRFQQEVYGSHPYGLVPTATTLQAVTRADLVDFHRRYVSPRNALLVIAGAVSRDDALALARRFFGDWRGTAAAAPTYPQPPAQGPTRILLVHRPGSVQSNILIGHVAIRPDNPDYFPLQVLNKILGGGTDARLFRILREERGWTYGAYSRISRPKDVGTFVANAEVRTEVTDSALREMLAQLRRLREEPIPEEEVRAAKEYLIGSFPLRLETASQIADQIAQTRLLGLPIEWLTQYRERIAAVTPADVQRVARQYVRPDQAIIVVVGDATKIYGKLQGIAPITLLDAEGRALSPTQVTAAPSAGGAATLPTGADLVPVHLVYSLQLSAGPFQAQGEQTLRLAREAQGWASRGDTKLEAPGVGELTIQAETRFDAALRPVSLLYQTAGGPVETKSELRIAEGRLRGTVPTPTGASQSVDVPVPPEAIFSDMVTWALARMDLTPGATARFTVIQPNQDRPQTVDVRVVGEETVSVAAGAFPAYKLELRQGDATATLWVRKDKPHWLLKQEVQQGPQTLRLELREGRPGGA